MVYTLYGAPLSLYSGKVRGYLRWKNVPYREVLATREVYAQEILPRIGWPVMPVIITPDDEAVQDSSDIIDHIEANEPGPSVYPKGPKQKLAALIMELFGDEYLLIAAMHYRWTYNEDFAFREFGKAVFAELPEDEQLAAGTKAGSRFRGFLPLLGITPKTRSAIEAVYEEFLTAFDNHLQAHDYLLGSRPSIGDYGLLGPLYAHNYRDPASGEMMKKIAPRVADWCLRTHGPQHPLAGEFIKDDLVPDTLLPLLEIFAKQHLPILLSTHEHLQNWHKQNPDAEEVPRTIGMHEVDMGGALESRGVIPYCLWMLQRVCDHVSSLSGDDKAQAENLLKSIGAQAVIGLEITPRLTRKNFKLALA